MRKRFYPIIFLTLAIITSIGGRAQINALGELSFDQYIQLVKTHHPVAVQANLQLAYGDAAVLKARGAFDPKLQTDVAQKYFDDKQYYSLIDGGLKIPTWFGVELSAGYEVNDGVFLNNQNRTPETGLLYAGIAVPIGQGLIIDKRRAELKKAKLVQEGTTLQRRIMFNDLILEAGLVYWEWYRAYREQQILGQAVALSTDRFNAVRELALVGERPFIDTVEASIQVQNRSLQYQQAQLNFSNATALVSIYLWSEGVVPLELGNEVKPLVVDSTEGRVVDLTYYGMVDTLVAQHPELGIYTNKLDQLAVQRKWNKEQLKPTLDLKYNPITEVVGDNLLSEFSTNNYTWGLNFNMPILLRKERAQLQQTDLKILETENYRKNKEAEITFKVTAALNHWQTTYGQIELYSQTIRDSEQLLNSERQLFDSGESSLFMINAREQAFIKAQLKLIELIIKNRMAEIKTKYALGLLMPDEQET